MKKAVQFGAGSIGRGFLGQLFSRSGYEVAFIEIDMRIVQAMNVDRRYPVRVVGGAGDAESYVERVRAVNGADFAAVARELVGAEVVGTAVGSSSLRRIAPALAAGLELRWRAEIMAPLNIIICENLVDADSALRETVADRLGAEDRARLSRLVGFVRASVGRMVPAMTEAMREGNRLRVWVEAYDRLQADADGFVGDIPTIANMESVSPFEFYVQRKLYIHNMGHAAVAYLGALRGYRYIWEAVGDPAVAEVARAAMGESARAIAAEHGCAAAPLLEHVEDLLTRFANRKLGDTIERVGRDLQRKLSPRDRLAGAIALCARHGLPREHIAQALAAALLFDDGSSASLRESLASQGPLRILSSLCGLEPDSPDASAVVAFYEKLKVLSL